MANNVKLKPNVWLNVYATFKSQNIVNNTSTYNIKGRLNNPYGTYPYAGASASYAIRYRINGPGYSLDTGLVNDYSYMIGDIYVYDFDVVVTHNANGKPPSSVVSITISGGANNGLTGTGEYTADTTILLPDIPRASTVTTFSNFTIGSNIAWAVDRKYSAYTHKVELLLGDTVINSMNSTGASGTLSITQAMKNQMLDLVSNATYIQATLRVTTYTNSNYNVQVGSVQTASATASVGADILPNFTNITHSEAVSEVNTKVGRYVQNKTKLNLAITGATAGRGASIKSYYLEIAGQALNAASGVTQEINANGNVEIIGRVTDSRNRVITKVLEINILPYFSPKVENLSGQRCLSDGTLNDYGTYIKVKGKATVASLLAGSAEKNKLTYNIQSRQNPNGSWATKTTQTKTVLTFDFEHILNTYSVDYSYSFMLQVLDVFDIATIALGVIAIGKVTMQWGDDWLAVARLATQAELDEGYKLIVGGKAKFDNDVVDKNGNQFQGIIVITRAAFNTLQANSQLIPGQIYYIKEA